MIEGTAEIVQNTQMEVKTTFVEPSSSSPQTPAITCGVTLKSEIKEDDAFNSPRVGTVVVDSDTTETPQTGNCKSSSAVNMDLITPQINELKIRLPAEGNTPHVDQLESENKIMATAASQEQEPTKPADDTQDALQKEPILSESMKSESMLVSEAQKSLEKSLSTLDQYITKFTLFAAKVRHAAAYHVDDSGSSGAAWIKSADLACALSDKLTSTESLLEDSLQALPQLQASDNDDILVDENGDPAHGYGQRGIALGRPAREAGRKAAAALAATGEVAAAAAAAAAGTAGRRGRPTGSGWKQRAAATGDNLLVLAAVATSNQHRRYNPHHRRRTYQHHLSNHSPRLDNKPVVTTYAETQHAPLLQTQQSLVVSPTVDAVTKSSDAVEDQATEKARAAPLTIKVSKELDTAETVTNGEDDDESEEISEDDDEDEPSPSIWGLGRGQRACPSCGQGIACACKVCKHCGHVLRSVKRIRAPPINSLRSPTAAIVTPSTSLVDEQITNTPLKKQVSESSLPLVNGSTNYNNVCSPAAEADAIRNTPTEQDAEDDHIEVPKRGKKRSNSADDGRPNLDLPSLRDQRALRRELALPATVDLCDPDASTVFGAVFGKQVTKPQSEPSSRNTPSAPWSLPPNPMNSSSVKRPRGAHGHARLWRARQTRTGADSNETETTVTGLVDPESLYEPGTIKHACYTLLLQVGAKGLTASTIVERTRQEGYHDWGSAKTPENSVVAALSQDDNFVRVAPSTYALRAAAEANGIHIGFSNPRNLLSQKKPQGVNNLLNAFNANGQNQPQESSLRKDVKPMGNTDVVEPVFPEPDVKSGVQDFFPGRVSDSPSKTLKRSSSDAALKHSQSGMEKTPTDITKWSCAAGKKDGFLAEIKYVQERVRPLDGTHTPTSTARSPEVRESSVPLKRSKLLSEESEESDKEDEGDNVEHAGLRSLSLRALQAAFKSAFGWHTTSKNKGWIRAKLKEHGHHESLEKAADVPQGIRTSSISSNGEPTRHASKFALKFQKHKTKEISASEATSGNRVLEVDAANRDDDSTKPMKNSLKINDCGRASTAAPPATKEEFKVSLKQRWKSEFKTSSHGSSLMSKTDPEKGKLADHKMSTGKPSSIEDVSRQSSVHPSINKESRKVNTHGVQNSHSNLQNNNSNLQRTTSLLQNELEQSEKETYKRKFQDLSTDSFEKTLGLPSSHGSEKGSKNLLLKDGIPILKKSIQAYHTDGRANSKVISPPKDTEASTPYASVFGVQNTSHSDRVSLTQDLGKDGTKCAHTRHLSLGSDDGRNPITDKTSEIFPSLTHSFSSQGLLQHQNSLKIPAEDRVLVGAKLHLTAS